MRKYPAIRTRIKTTLMVYTDSLDAMVKEVPGDSNADKFNTLVKYWYDNKDISNLEYLWSNFYKAKVLEEIKNG